MINLFLAVGWLLLGLLLLANPWNSADVRQTVFGWFSLALSMVNVIRWRFQVRARRRAEEWQPNPHDEPHRPKVTDPDFDFSDQDDKHP